MEANRREFLGRAAAPMIASATVWGANDRVTYGMIGTGSRGRWLNQAFQKLGAQCVALCDVYQPHLELARNQSPKDARPYADYHDLLAHPGLDSVVIATPDHQHAPNLLAALEAAKDVYLEKPLSLTLEESAKMVQAVRGARQIVEIGMHRRSMQFVYQSKKLIDGGALGRVRMVKAMWNWHFTVPLDNSPLPGQLDWKGFLGAAPERPLEPKRFRWWRAFWDYSGGNMTDQGTHLMDVVQWMMDAGPPRSAVCHGYIADATAGEVPDVFTAVFEYPGFMATWTLNYTSSYDHDWSILFQGDKATMIMDRLGYRIYKDAGPSPAPWSQSAKPELIGQAPDRDAPEAHPRNFLDCVRSRREPNCTVEIAAAAVTGPHMANLALLRDKKIKLAPDGAAA